MVPFATYQNSLVVQRLQRLSEHVIPAHNHASEKVTEAHNEMRSFNEIRHSTYKRKHEVHF
jgi:hypothetical protein